MAKRPKIEKVAVETPDLLAERREALRQLFPDAIAEGKVDLAKFREALGDFADDRPERYSFTWAGKREAIRLLQTPSRATLRPRRDESINFDDTKHLFIEGENLEVLKLLYKSYAGRVKMIYIDPPYNTGKDFIYPDDYADPLRPYLQMTGQMDAEGNLLTSNPESSGRYHSAWLSMMYPRLFVARQLLREDGVIFVSIDDTEVSNLIFLMNEIFGEENYLGNIIWQHSVQPKGYTGKFSVHHNYILCYTRYGSFELETLERTEEHNKNYSNPDNDPKGLWRPGDVRNALYRPNLIYDINTPSGKVIQPPQKGWRWSKSTVEKKIKTGEIIFNKDETKIIRKIYLNDIEGRTPESIWFGKDVGTTRSAVKELKDLFDNEVPFDTPKPTSLIDRMLNISTTGNENELILDFFSGSSSLAHAVLMRNNEKYDNLQFIVVQLQEPTQINSASKTFNTISDIGKERIRRVITKMKSERESELPLESRGSPEDLGFRVFALSESHYKRWSGAEERDTEALADQMTIFADPLEPGWREEDVLWEIALKEGLSLTSRIERVLEPKGKAKSGNTVWRITDDDKEQSLLVCLDDRLDPATPAALNLSKDTIFICRDLALDDNLAANLALQCRLKTI